MVNTLRVMHLQGVKHLATCYTQRPFFLHALVLLPFSSPSPSLLLAFQALTSESSYVNESVAFRCFDFAEKHGYAFLM